ncbi:MAG: glycosyltransferase [Bacteroidetes bacterium]|nr:glycosyltransferase [Bacteroidota bacterium]
MMKNAKTLVILSPGFPKDELDSTCLPAQQSFILALKNNFPSLKIIVLSFQYPFVKREYNWHGIEVIAFAGHDRSGFQRVKTWISVWKEMRRRKKNNSIIGLFSFWCTECALVGKYFAKRNNLNHYIWILGQDAKVDNHYIRWINPRSEELVAMSDFLAKEFLNNYSVKPKFVIPNGIDPALYANTILTRDIDILGAGSLIGLKQYEIFIEVVGALAKENPSINTMICGDGPEQKNLQALINRLGLEKNVVLAGKKSHPELLELMQRCRIFLHPSSYEGFSSVCLEALYAGARVISFFKPMAAWINHWMIVHDKKEMAEKITEILDDPEIDYRPVLPYPMKDSAKAVMKLFNYNDAATS